MNLDRVRAIYAEIEKYEVPLASDPRSLGPRYLQNTIAECRNFLNAIGRVQLEVHREKQDVSRQMRLAETAYEVEFAEILSNDERVRRLPSIEDRKATANVILRVRLNEISTLRAELQDLEFVDKAVRHRHKELTSTMSEIKLQRSIIRDEIDSGAMYGDERAGGRTEPSRGPVGGVEDDGIDEETLSAMLDHARTEQEGTPAQVEPAVVSPAVERAPAEGETVSDDDTAKVQEFLAESATSPEVEDFEEVFNNF